MSDRRRINGPASGTAPPVFVAASNQSKQIRERKGNELRKIFLRTGIIPAANGSAYLELELPAAPRSLLPSRSTVKLSCSVHGPKPLGRNSNFSANLQLAASVKFAPFATHVRRGYIRDSTERDLGVHLENALKGVIIPDRWPKSAIEIAVVVLEGEGGVTGLPKATGVEDVGLMNVLSGCITVSMAALADAKIDCLDIMAGGVVATIPKEISNKPDRILDPNPLEHTDIRAACVVGYLPGRDEITELWIRGEVNMESDEHNVGFHEILDSAIGAARGVNKVVQDVLKDSLKPVQMNQSQPTGKAHKSYDSTNDVEMQT